MRRLGNVLIEVIEDLSQISTNGHARLRVNDALTTPQQFHSLFNYFTRGTILENVDMDVEPLDTYANCACGYEEQVEGDHSGYRKCPECGRFANIEEKDYELVSPDPKHADQRQTFRF
jgi:Hydrogenase expression/synthesis hypA family.